MSRSLLMLVGGLFAVTPTTLAAIVTLNAACAAMDGEVPIDPDAQDELADGERQIPWPGHVWAPTYEKDVAALGFDRLMLACSDATARRRPDASVCLTWREAPGRTPIEATTTQVRNRPRLSPGAGW